MILVDSTVWIDYFNGVINPQTDCLDHILGEEFLIVGDLILAEVLHGFRNDDQFEEARQALSHFHQASLVTPHLAILSAQNYRFLRRNGVTVRKTIDCLIATCCIERDYRLLHKDNDFDPFEIHLGLQVIHP